MKPNCIAMVLAGGLGERLGSLTYNCSKPAVYFGGDKRIIDYTLMNCLGSNIPAIGVLSQHFSDDLHKHIDDTYRGGHFYMLPANLTGRFYKGTADAVYKNIRFIDRLAPDHVLILAGDLVYEMDYAKMIAFHIERGADVTIASALVPLEDASHYGIIEADEDGRIYAFEGKPGKPKSNLASMGIYVFKWSILKEILIVDSENNESQHDFRRNILPSMQRADEIMYSYLFHGYWRDVGTLESLWKANMEMLDGKTAHHFMNITKSYKDDESNVISDRAVIHHSVMHGRCAVDGNVFRSVLSHSVQVRFGAEIISSVIMPNVYIGSNAKICNAIIGEGARIADNATIGANDGISFFVEPKLCTGGVSLVEPGLHVLDDLSFLPGSHIDKEMLQEYLTHVDMAPGPDFHPSLWKELNKE
jgi:glucose-1-phosphate adenylyltransferase